MGSHGGEEEDEEWVWEALSSALVEAKAAQDRAPAQGLASLVDQAESAMSLHAKLVEEATAAAEAAEKAAEEEAAARAKAAEEARIRREAQGIQSVGTGPTPSAVPRSEFESNHCLAPATMPCHILACKDVLSRPAAIHK